MLHKASSLYKFKLVIILCLKTNKLFQYNTKSNLYNKYDLKLKFIPTGKFKNLYCIKKYY